MANDVTAKCHSDQYRGECQHIMSLNSGVPVCTCQDACYRRDEKTIEERLERIKQRVDYSLLNGFQAGARTEDACFILSLIEGLKKKNLLLEARIFRGIDPRGRTNTRKLCGDLEAAMLADDTDYMDNDALLAHVGRHQA